MDKVLAELLAVVVSEPFWLLTDADFCSGLWRKGVILAAVLSATLELPLALRLLGVDSFKVLQPSVFSLSVSVTTVSTESLDFTLSSDFLSSSLLFKLPDEPWSFGSLNEIATT